ncbi:MAG TPA: general secretion pathway protein GspK [Alphaproteobacteria bacterium]|nr:general secretion pathway protein GspK [Alphaproteobacteria bacterium]
MTLPNCPKTQTRSFALIIALLAVFVLTANAAVLWYSMQVDMKLASKSQNNPQLLWLGRSGMELAKWILSVEANVPGKPYDSLEDYWAGGSGGPNETNSPLANISMSHYQIGDGWVSVSIIDEERKININTISPQLLNQVLTAMGVDANDMPTVSDSILDWVQPGDNPRLSGAKNAYYMSLNPPYFCKEAPMDDIGELLLVKGVTPMMYTGQAPAGTKPTAAPKGFGYSPFDNNGYAFGFRDVFTPYSDGRININTADANVLQCIPGVDPSTADAIIKARTGDASMGETGADGSGPFKSVGEVQRAGISPQAVQSIGQYCDVRSHTFQVTITAHYLTDTQTYIGVLWRNTPSDIRLVQFYAAQPLPQQPVAAPAQN